jgi:ATP-dependent Clp protease ATP-binding subunit ClpA
MFERFTAQARGVVVGAHDEARALHHDAVRDEHLLIALAAAEDGPACAALRAEGLSPDTLRDAVRDRPALDADALASIGIDLEAVRSSVESAFGPGALDRRPRGRGRARFDRSSKRVLEGALRVAIRRRDRHIGPEHILLGLLDEPAGRATAVLRDLGVDGGRLRERLASA